MVLSRLWDFTSKQNFFVQTTNTFLIELVEFYHCVLKQKLITKKQCLFMLNMGIKQNGKSERYT